MSTIVAVWRPGTLDQVEQVRHVAGLYDLTVTEVLLKRHLELLIEHHGPLVSLEMDTHAVPLDRFQHAESGVYLVGPMNGSIPKEVLDLGRVVQVETPRRYPLRPHVAAGIVLHDRYIQQIGEAA